MGFFGASLKWPFEVLCFWVFHIGLNSDSLRLPLDVKTLEDRV